MQFVSRIGIELEGGWSTKQLLPLVEWDWKSGRYHLPITNDESLMHGQFESEHVGEVISPPLRLEEAITWMKKHYPTETNNACGLHIHTSFNKTVYYKALMQRDFFEYFLTEMGEWELEKKGALGLNFAVRLKGANKYCTREFIPDKQINLKNKHSTDGGPVHLRRTLLNYCWGLHKTLECRLFPMWADPALSEEGIRKLMNIYEGYLSKQTFEEEPTRSVALIAKRGILSVERKSLLSKRLYKKKEVR